MMGNEISSKSDLTERSDQKDTEGNSGMPIKEGTAMALDEEVQCDPLHVFYGMIDVCQHIGTEGESMTSSLHVLPAESSASTDERKVPTEASCGTTSQSLDASKRRKVALKSSSTITSTSATEVSYETPTRFHDEERDSNQRDSRATPSHGERDTTALIRLEFKTPLTDPSCINFRCPADSPKSRSYSSLPNYAFNQEGNRAFPDDRFHLGGSRASSKSRFHPEDSKAALDSGSYQQYCQPPPHIDTARPASLPTYCSYIGHSRVVPNPDARYFVTVPNNGVYKGENLVVRNADTVSYTPGPPSQSVPDEDRKVAADPGRKKYDTIPIFDVVLGSYQTPTLGTRIWRQVRRPYCKNGV